VLPTPFVLLTVPIARGGSPFLLLGVHLSIRRQDSVSLVLRLGVLGTSSGGKTVVGGEVQDTLLCLVVAEMVFSQYIFSNIIVGFGEQLQ
jgi:hypothetical protein